MGGKPSRVTPADKRLAVNKASTPKTGKAAGGRGGAKAARKSPLSAAANRKRNTKKGRAAMPASDFGLPAQKKYRIDDPAHARDALGRAKQHAGPAQQAQIRRRVAAKFPSINLSGRTK